VSEVNAKVRIRCSLKAELYEALAREANQHKVDLGTVIEGYVVQARQQGHAMDSVIMRRLETLLHGQEQLLRVLEALVATMEGRQGLAASALEGEHDPPPIASYAQMYGAEKTAPQTPETPAVTEAPASKRSWRPW